MKARCLAATIALSSILLPTISALAQLPCRFDLVLVVEDSRALDRADPNGTLPDAVLRLIRRIPHQNRMALVSFAGKAELLRPLQRLSDAHKFSVRDALRKLERKSGYADVPEVVDVALRQFAKPAGERDRERVIVVVASARSDVPGSTAAQRRALRELRNETVPELIEDKIRVVVAALEEGLTLPTWADVAEQTGGAVVHVTDPEHDFATQLTAVRKHLCANGAEVESDAVTTPTTPVTRETSSPPVETRQAVTTPEPEVAGGRDDSEARRVTSSTSSGAGGAGLWAGITAGAAALLGLLGWLLLRRRPAPGPQAARASRPQRQPVAPSRPTGGITTELDDSVLDDPGADKDAGAAGFTASPGVGLTLKLGALCPNHPRVMGNWTCRFCGLEYCRECLTRIDGVEVCPSRSCRAKARDR